MTSFFDTRQRSGHDVSGPLALLTLTAGAGNIFIMNQYGIVTKFDVPDAVGVFAAFALPVLAGRAGRGAFPVLDSAARATISTVAGAAAAVGLTWGAMHLWADDIIARRQQIEAIRVMNEECKAASGEISGEFCLYRDEHGQPANWTDLKPR